MNVVVLCDSRKYIPTGSNAGFSSSKCKREEKQEILGEAKIWLKTSETQTMLCT